MPAPKDAALIDALLLLEMGMEGMSPQYGTPEDYMAGAHSYIQHHRSGQEVSEHARGMVARIMADVAIEDAKESARYPD